MHFRDQLLAGPRGHFLLKVFHRGVLVDQVDEPNLIVVGSKLAHARLLGGDVTDRSVEQIGFGTSGTAPASGNTSLTGIYAKEVDDVDYPNTNEVRFHFSLDASENNGMAIMEFGLLTGGGALYARKVRASALNKDADLALAGTWTIEF